MNIETYISSIEESDKILSKELVVLFYFSTTSCNVGEALEPKVVKLLVENFQKIKFYKIDINFSQELAAKYSVFVEPTIIVFFEGKETFRKSRNIGIFELENAIKRPYQLIFQ